MTLPAAIEALRSACETFDYDICDSARPMYHAAQALLAKLDEAKGEFVTEYTAVNHNAMGRSTHTRVDNGMLYFFPLTPKESEG
jgi:hypothetical protein